jgi:hypothetical protein
MKAFNIKKIRTTLEIEFDISIKEGRNPNSYHLTNVNDLIDEKREIADASSIFQLMLEEDHIQLTGGNTFTRFSPGDFKNNTQITSELIGTLPAYLLKQILRAKKLKLLGI